MCVVVCRVRVSQEYREAEETIKSVALKTTQEWEGQGLRCNAEADTDETDMQD